MNVDLGATFMGPDGRRLFVITHKPVSVVRGCVLLVPPFGDEMNKSRHLLADVARGLVAAGFCTVLPDLYGTGDSDGEFREATWEHWKEDLRCIGTALAQQGLTIEAMLCIRTGAALGIEVARDAGWPLKQTIIWQPVADGSRFLTQFLRLRVAASLGSDQAETVAGLRQRLKQGEVLEVAGYELSPALAQQLDRVSLAPLLASARGAILWLEIVPSGETMFPPLSAAGVAQAQASGADLQAVAVAGEPFWASSELVRVPELARRTIAALADQP